MFRSLHWRNLGREAMLQILADIWRQRIQRDVVLLAQSCPNCQNAGNNLRKVHAQKNYVTISAAVTNHSDEIGIDSAGPFTIAKDTTNTY